MVQRTARASNDEPEQKSFDLPSEKEHLFQVVDVYDFDNNPYNFDLGPDEVIAKCEVVSGEESGRTLLNRMSLTSEWKGFFATRLFLKAIGEPYKGDEFPIDTDNWQARQFYATVVHNKSKTDKVYANIKEFNLDKIVDQAPVPKIESAPTSKPEEEIAWDEA
jgi:hypothetical protein